MANRPARLGRTLALAVVSVTLPFVLPVVFIYVPALAAVAVFVYRLWRSWWITVLWCVAAVNATPLLMYGPRDFLLAISAEPALCISLNLAGLLGGMLAVYLGRRWERRKADPEAPEHQALT